MVRRWRRWLSSETAATPKLLPEGFRMKPSFLLPALLLIAGAAHAYEFKSVGPAASILYDGPSLKSKKLFIAPSGMPVEVVQQTPNWVKVRDASGGMAWIELKALTAKRTLVVKVPRVKVRLAADEAAPPVFTADKGVLLEWVEADAPGWIKVRHRDGQSGHVRISEVWGQ
jgi:SH3-like domain-containing protein